MNRVRRDSVEPQFSIHWRSGLDGVSPHRSWSRCAPDFWDWKLPMNRPTPGPSQEGNSQACLDIDSPPPEGLGVGSWLRFTSGFRRCSLPMNRPTSGPSQEGNSASVPDIGSPPPERLGVGSWSQLTSKKWRCSLSRNLVATDVRRLSSISDFGFRIWSNEPHVGCYGSAVQCAKFFQEILPKGSASRRIQEFSVPSWLAGSLAPPKQPTTKKEAGVIRPLRRSHALLLRAEEQVPCADAGRVRADVAAVA